MVNVGRPARPTVAPSTPQGSADEDKRRVEPGFEFHAITRVNIVCKLVQTAAAARVIEYLPMNATNASDMTGTPVTGAPPMAAAARRSRASPARPWRVPNVREVRLATGLVLFAFVTTHLLNHALGNVSINAMELGLKVVGVWRSLPGAIVLYAALLTHMTLGFWTLFARRSFRFTRAEAAQLVFGLAIPLLLVDHVLGTRVSLTLFGTDKGYAEELLKFWVRAPGFGVLQAVLLLIVWIHGCLGIHFWLRLKPFYPRVRDLMLAVAVLIPVLALLGFYRGGMAVQALVHDPAWQAQHLVPQHVGTSDQNAALARYRNDALIVFAVLFALIFLARGWRRLMEARQGLVALVYPKRAIRVPRGLSVLEASLRYNIPHAHVCGGRGRCSTCRVRILGRHDDLPPASAAERAVLERVQGGTGVRLACQLRPPGDITIVPLLPPDATVAAAYAGSARRLGEERYVVIMFVDMRGATTLAESRLPFDTVFVINRFHTAVSSAVTAAGGMTIQIMGDGLMALFGLHGDRAEGCRQAALACAAIAEGIARLNESLAEDLREPIRFGIGINAGTVIAGEFGYGETSSFMVVGDPVNVAARVQDLTKQLGCEVVMAEEVYAQAGFAPDDLPPHDVEVRGRAASVRVRGAKRAADLGELLSRRVDAPAAAAPVARARA